MGYQKTHEGRGWRNAAYISLTIWTLICILPVVLLFMSSMTDETAIVQNGYSFFPAKFGFAAYQYLYAKVDVLIRAYGISIFVTVFGTGVGLVIMSMLAYPLSRNEFPYRRLFTFFVVFTILFNGGLVPTYLLYTKYLGIKNTVWALIFPYLFVRGFSVLMLKSYFRTSIPDSVIEAARLDGLGEIQILFRIVYPLATPVLATVALLQGILYWNDWFNGLIFLTKPNLFSIQNFLNRMLLDVQFMAAASDSAEVASQIAKLPSVTIRMAVAVIGILPMLIAYPFFQKHFVRGIAMGAVKG